MYIGLFFWSALIFSSPCIDKVKRKETVSWERKLKAKSHDEKEGFSFMFNRSLKLQKLSAIYLLRQIKEAL